MMGGLEPPKVPTPFFLKAFSDPASIPNRFLFNSGTWATEARDTRAGRAAEIGAANGITNGRGLAGMYAPLANGGGGLVDADTLSRMERIATRR